MNQIKSEFTSSILNLSIEQRLRFHCRIMPYLPWPFQSCPIINWLLFYPSKANLNGLNMNITGLLTSSIRALSFSMVLSSAFNCSAFLLSHWTIKLFRTFLIEQVRLGNVCSIVCNEIQCNNYDPAFLLKNVSEWAEPNSTSTSLRAL